MVNPSGSSAWRRRCGAPSTAGSRCPARSAPTCRVSTDSDTAGGAFSSLAHFAEHVLELVGEVLQGVFGFFDGDVAAADEGLGVDLPDAALGVDDVVHRGLGHRGVVALVVAAAPVADHVDHDVVVPALPVLHRQLGHPDTGLGVVAVHVEDGGADHLGHVGAVLAAAGGFGGGGEPDLVVDDHVHGAAGAVAAQQGQVQGFGDHALAGERGVAVQHQRHDRVAALAHVEQVLLGPHDALQHRVDGLQVRRVGGEGDGGLAVAEHAEVLALGAEVVLDVAGAVRPGRGRGCPRTRGRSARSACRRCWPAR